MPSKTPAEFGHADAALDCSKLRTELQWFPDVSFAAGLRKTVDWYLSNRPWLDNVLSGDYRRWIERNYAARGTP